MDQLIVVVAVAGALIMAAGSGLAQQPAAPGGGPLTTCSGMAQYCKSGCEPHSGQGTRQCTLNCDKHLAECMASGMWKNLATGQLVPKRKE